MATKKVTVTIPEDLLAEIREVVGERGLSMYVAEALEAHRQRDRWGEILDWLEQEHGALTDEEVDAARAELEADQQEIRRRREQASGQPQETRAA